MTSQPNSNHCSDNASENSLPSKNIRIEKDSLGEMSLPIDALYGIQTQRAITNFRISDLRMPSQFIVTLALVKKLAAKVNMDLKLLDLNIGNSIIKACNQIINGNYREHFPVDVFQTGSGTSTHMNINEVIANLASTYLDIKISPTDHVNLGQSSNDVIPTAIHISTAIECHKLLLPNLNILASIIDEKAQEFESIIKTGRTHLMDALPIKVSQEFNAWSCQLRKGMDRINSTMPRVYMIAQGGTAVGTGVNAHPQFSKLFAAALRNETGLPFIPNSSLFESLSSQDTMVELSGQLKVIAVSLMKISNDLRWMNSGPLFGLGEITLKALQAGSSIMPGKVNPVIPESVTMVAAQVIGNDTTITIAGQSGNFQLNAMLPVIAYNILQSISLLGNASLALAQNCLSEIKINKNKLEQNLSRNPILITSLTPIIGYAKAVEIVKSSYTQNRAIIDVASEMTSIDRTELEKLLDPKLLV